MKHSYIKREGDSEILKGKKEILKNYTDKDLVEAYNIQFICGISGAHEQQLYLFALGFEFLMRFAKCPIYTNDNVIFMRDSIKLSANTFEYNNIMNDKPRQIIHPMDIIPGKNSLEPLFIEETLNSPGISCNATNGVIEIGGRNGNNTGHKFYEPLLNWVSSYGEMTSQQTIVNIRFEYLDSVGSMNILTFFKLLERINKRKNNIVINWYYEENDKDMLESGNDYADMISVPIKIIPVKKKTHTIYWITNFRENPYYGHLRFKKLIEGLGGYPPFDIDESLVDLVDIETFVKKEVTRIPLLIGTQFGIYPRLDEVSLFFKEEIIFAILGKSVLSGHVAGLGIYKLPICSFLNDRKELVYFNNI
jgi:hypothetical protein